jgi:hypothetical protein
MNGLRCIVSRASRSCVSRVNRDECSQRNRGFRTARLKWHWFGLNQFHFPRIGSRLSALGMLRFYRLLYLFTILNLSNYLRPVLNRSEKSFFRLGYGGRDFFFKRSRFRPILKFRPGRKLFARPSVPPKFEVDRTIPHQPV